MNQDLRDCSGFQLGAVAGFRQGTTMSIGVNLRVSLAVETAAIQTKPACAGYKASDFTLVRVGGLPFGNADAPNVATASLTRTFL